MTNGQLAFALELFALNVVTSGEALEQALGQGFNHRDYEQFWRAIEERPDLEAKWAALEAAADLRCDLLPEEYE